ncbi:MAG: dTDP-4-dehydrorhamnose reductase [Actinobacteria bacterium]|nr:dTDP-4-dehydrorhamnose reductase [Actinomycetota bacterium]
MKILITGSKGQLGSELVELLSKDNEVYGFGHEELDITDKNCVIEIISKIVPDIIIHSAAFTNVDGCESNIKTAFDVNIIGTGNVAMASKKNKSKMVYISTDYIFDGKKNSPYLESDIPNPVSIYGISKYGGELVGKHFLDNFFIVRTSWLYGKRGKNFVNTILDIAKDKKELRVINDQVGSPTYVPDLAKAISALISTKYYGIYHITNSGECSWYEFTKKILKYAEIKDVKVIPISTEELNRPAPRPKYSVLANLNLEKRGIHKMRNWDLALKDFFKK